MVGALITAIVAGLLAIVLSSENKETHKPRSLALAAVSAFVASVSLLVAFPQALGWDQGTADTTVVRLLILAVGIILILAAFAAEKVPTAFVLLGMAIVVWAIFRMIPTAPLAFGNLGPNLTEAFVALKDAIVGFVEDLVP